MLDEIKDILLLDYKNTPGSMRESQAQMAIGIDSSGCQYLSYSFDKSVAKCPQGAIPLFSTKKGARSMCDYMLFCASDNKLFIILTELKRGNEQKLPQLKAGKCLAKYIVDSVNRLYEKNYMPEIRMVGISQLNLVQKGSTKMKPVKYDQNGYCLFKGKIFCLKEFLK